MIRLFAPSPSIRGSRALATSAAPGPARSRHVPSTAPVPPRGGREPRARRRQRRPSSAAVARSGNTARARASGTRASRTPGSSDSTMMRSPRPGAKGPKHRARLGIGSTITTMAPAALRRAVQLAWRADVDSPALPIREGGFDRAVTSSPADDDRRPGSRLLAHVVLAVATRRTADVVDRDRQRQSACDHRVHADDLTACRARAPPELPGARRTVRVMKVVHQAAGRARARRRPSASPQTRDGPAPRRGRHAQRCRNRPGRRPRRSVDAEQRPRVRGRSATTRCASIHRSSASPTPNTRAQATWAFVTTGRVPTGCLRRPRSRRGCGSSTSPAGVDRDRRGVESTPQRRRRSPTVTLNVPRLAAAQMVIVTTAPTDRAEARHEILRLCDRMPSIETITTPMISPAAPRLSDLTCTTMIAVC